MRTIHPLGIPRFFVLALLYISGLFTVLYGINLPLIIAITFFLSIIAYDLGLTAYWRFKPIFEQNLLPRWPLFKRNLLSYCIDYLRGADAASFKEAYKRESEFIQKCCGLILLSRDLAYPGLESQVRTLVLRRDMQGAEWLIRTTQRQYREQAQLELRAQSLGVLLAIEPLLWTRHYEQAQELLNEIAVILGDARAAGIEEQIRALILNGRLAAARIQVRTLRPAHRRPEKNPRQILDEFRARIDLSFGDKCHFQELLDAMAKYPYGSKEYRAARFALDHALREIEGKPN